MSPGRNDPCPCGSGKKFKKCCINAPSDSVGPIISPVELNNQIEYEGDVGLERKKWCEEYIVWKTAELKKMTVKQKQLEESEGNRISCSKGCSFCCSQYIGASLQECEAIRYWLYQHKKTSDAFLTRYQDWKKNLLIHNDVYQQVMETFNNWCSNPSDKRTEELFLQKSDEYCQLNIPCPFLEEGVCSIYPVRPFVCATHTVTSPPENCNPSNEKIPVVLFGVPIPEPELQYFRRTKAKIILGHASNIVYKIIKGDISF